MKLTAHSCSHLIRPHGQRIVCSGHRSQFPISTILLLGLVLFVAGCASQPFTPQSVSSAPYLERGVTQTEGPLRVTAAVPDEGETRDLFGIDLYEQGIQPIWLEVENTGDHRVRLALWSVDPDYFSPIEVAYMNRGGYSKAGKADMERWFYENRMGRRVQPGETRSGFVYTHLMQGTKGFNLDIYSNLQGYYFTFFVPIPGITADYMEVDFEGLYAEAEVQVLDEDGLRQALQDEVCCSTDETGTRTGDPFNMVLIGTGVSIRRGLMRAGWHETPAGSPDTAVARTHRYRGRQPDGTFHKTRPDGSELKELRLWLTPLQLGEQLVLIGQVSNGLKRTGRETEFVDYRIDPDLDDARIYLVQDFWYGQSLAQVGHVTGAERAPIESPHQNFSGQPYFTDGLRAVLLLSEDPIAMDDATAFDWEQLVDYRAR